MSPRKRSLIIRAREKYGIIFPIKPNVDLDQCITELLPGQLCLWFNTLDHSTHVILEQGDLHATSYFE